MDSEVEYLWDMKFGQVWIGLDGGRRKTVEFSGIFGLGRAEGKLDDFWKVLKGCAISEIMLKLRGFGEGFLDEYSGDSAPRESVSPRLDIQSGVECPRSPIAPLCIVVLVSVSLLPCAGLSAGRLRSKTISRMRPRDLRPGLCQCFPNVSRCSGIVVISVCPEYAPKIRREASVTTETFLGKPCKAPKGHLRLVP
ncbi:hypothetical protein CDL15_Pgr024847 [Punica granatum]|uniref:Uncharacterized protein n=1 Tax=Punica granatum TaxID=22663 RepID=A0A218XBV2_PUNGR|nr:hypothetical protein CDL15_Pgr024847 [Punica granatum]